MKKRLLQGIANVTPATRNGGTMQDAGHNDRRASLAAFFLITLALITFVFGLLNLFYFDFLLLASAELIVFLVVSAALVDLRKHRHVERTAYITVAAFGVLSIFFYWYIAAAYSGSVWLLLFPMIAFFLLGTRKGIPVYVGFIGIIFAIIYSKADEWVTLESAATLSNIAGSLIAFGMIVCFQERTKERAYDKIFELANTDGLTGIANRRHFIEKYSELKGRSQKPDASVSLLLVDIDHFKEINDMYGHLAGDHVIQCVSFRIASMVRKGDILGRLGGEEFGVLLIDCDHKRAEHRAELIRETVSERLISYGEHNIPATVSVGVASDRLGAQDFTGLFAQADERLYKAKAQGRDRVVASIAELGCTHYSR